MCEEKQVEKIVSRLNKKQDISRDEKLEKKLDAFFYKVSEKIDKTVKKRISNIKLHKTAPETKEKLEELIIKNNKVDEALVGFKDHCSTQSGELNTNQKLMQQSLKTIQTELSSYIKADKEWKNKKEIKEVKREEKIEKMIKDVDDKYARKDEVLKIRANITWAVRLVVGAVIMALVALVLKS